MKFYYQGKLVRTSKTHNYKYGVFTKENDCLACASSFELAQNSIASATMFKRSSLKSYNKILKAIKQGKEKIILGRNIFKITETAEQCEEQIKKIEEYLKGIHIEELTQGE